MVNNRETDNCQVNQAMHEMQQVVDTLRQTVDSWNEEYPQQQHETTYEEQQEEQPDDIGPEFPLEEVRDETSSQVHPPPGLSSASMAGSETNYCVNIRNAVV